MNLFQDPTKYGGAEWGIILAAAVVAFVAYKQGWFTTDDRARVKYDPATTAPTERKEFDGWGWFGEKRNIPVDPTKNATRQKTDAQLTNLIQRTRTVVLDSWNLAGTQADFYAVLESINDLGDADLTAMANLYAAKYRNDDYKSLADLLASEWTWIGSETSYLRDSVVQRLTDLGVA